MTGEELELLENFRKLTPGNKRQVLANIRRVSLAETTEAVCEETGAADAATDKVGEA
jgi:hypothetical protein